MNQKNRYILEAIAFIVGLILVYLGSNFYTLLYTSDVEFGSRYTLLNKYIMILGPAALISIGVMLIIGQIKSKWARFNNWPIRRVIIGLFVFCAILTFNFMLTIWIGLPFDATDWGVTAILFGKAFIAVLPAILCVIMIISLLIATSDNFWMMIFKCVIIIGLTALIYIGIVPRIMVYL